MQIPMEILSLITPRADTGADIRQKTPTTKKADSVFDKILDESHTAITYEKTTDTGKTDEMPEKEYIESATRKKHDKEPGEGDIFAAGAMGYHNAIVLILEGDKESAATPEVDYSVVQILGTSATADNAASAEIIADDEPELAYTDKTAGPPTYIDPDMNTEPDMKDAMGTKIAADTKAEPGAETKPDTVTAADVKIAVEENTSGDANAMAGPENNLTANYTDTGIEADRAAVEATEREPVIRASEQRENEDAPDFSESGYLRPLDNENGKISMKGQKEKADSETGGAAENTARGAQEQMNSYPVPLTESISPERFQADQQMRQAADTPVRTANLFDEMVSRIETMHTGNQQSVTIQLKPEILGKVALEIAMDAAGLHIKINAADSDVRSMINGQINTLIESLENKGIEVVDVEVAYTGVDNGAFQEPHKDQAQPERHRQSYRVDGIEDNAAYYAALPFEMLEYYLDADVSSVEYRV